MLCVFFLETGPVKNLQNNITFANVIVLYLSHRHDGKVFQLCMLFNESRRIDLGKLGVEHFRFHTRLSLTGASTCFT